jgi:hypothetical protein
MARMWSERLLSRRCALGLAAGAVVGGAFAGEPLRASRKLPVAEPNGSGAPAASLPLPTPTTRTGRWQADIDYLAATLPRVESGGTVDVTPAEFHQQAAALRASVPIASDEQLTVGIMQLVARLGVAHAAAHQVPEPNRYPLVFRRFPDGYRVVATTASQHHDLLGALLTSIAGLPADDVLRRLSTTISHENDAWLSALTPERLVNTTVLQGLGITAPDHGEFAFLTTAGRRLSRDLTATLHSSHDQQFPAWSKQPLYAQNDQANFWYRYLSDSQTSYIRYRVCADPVGLATLTKQIFADAARLPVARMVFDLRDNGGGNSQVFAPLLAALASSPLNSRGRLFAIIDRGTFSSGMLNALDLSQNTAATLVGEATGGKPNSYGEVQAFRLPYSDLSIEYATRFFQLVPGDPPSLAPAVTVEFPYAAYAAGEDPYLEAILGRPVGS